MRFDLLDILDTRDYVVMLYQGERQDAAPKRQRQMLRLSERQMLRLSGSQACNQHHPANNLLPVMYLGPSQKRREHGGLERSETNRNCVEHADRWMLQMVSSRLGRGMINTAVATLIVGAPAVLFYG